MGLGGSRRVQKGVRGELTDYSRKWVFLFCIISAMEENVKYSYMFLLLPFQSLYCDLYALFLD